MKAVLLAAGLGTRLRPLTDQIPKCLVPINDRALLEYWLEDLLKLEVEEILINTHHLADQVEQFLVPYSQSGRVKSIYEKELKGTGGTIRANREFFEQAAPVMVVHADNYCRSDLNVFLEAHQNRPDHTSITMLTFRSSSPEECGIVELDEYGRVIRFHEKVSNPPSDHANGAVYLFEQEVINFICNPKNRVQDLSLDLLPRYLGRIYCWEANGPHVDIGTPENYALAQSLATRSPLVLN